MSYYEKLELKGARKVSQEWSSTVSSPTNYKYLTIVGDMLSKGFISSTLLGMTSNAFDATGVDADEVGTDQYIISGTTSAPTAITPFKLTNQKITYHIRNNYKNTCVLTVFEIIPRTVISDTNNALNDTALTEVNYMVQAIQNGIADKCGVNAVQTNAVCNIHSAASGGTDAGALNGISFMELSLKDPLTIFDSSLFCNEFNVSKVETIVMKPGDSLTYVVRNADIFFRDGVDIYNQAETLFFDFQKYVFFQLRGAVGHEGTFNFTAGASTITPGIWVTDNVSGKKQSAQNCGFVETVLDYVAYYESDVEIYDATLSAAGIGMSIDTAMNRDDMADTLISITHDLE